MRIFIALCLLSITCADKLGYDYRAVQHSDSGLSFVPGLTAPLPSDAQATAPFKSVSSIGQSYGEIPPLNVLSYATPSDNSAEAAALTLESASIAPVVEYEKEFFSFSAPQEQEDFSGLQHQLEYSLKKNLRVIFIKGPDNQIFENLAGNLAQHASKHQTAIYVLQKQPDLSQFANKLNSINNVNNQKPEVHFVKYRTAKDAAEAQQAIQAQYDQLSGSSLSHNGGLAPVLNFASPVASPSATTQEPKNQYLPASVFLH